jgi:hypothetical protein
MNRGRALAAVIVLVALAPINAAAQNLEAGKSPGQLFSSTCSACHRSPRGLLRTVPPPSLPGFLREHYTTSRDMAQQLSGFLIANGAADPRAKPQDARQEPRDVRGSPQQAQQAPASEAPRPQRPIEAEQAQGAPEQPARTAAEERRAKRERRAKNNPDPAAEQAVQNSGQKARRIRISPRRLEAATARGKDAAPLGAILKVEDTVPKAVPVAPAAPEPAAAPPPEPAPVQTEPAPQPPPAAAETERGDRPAPDRETPAAADDAVGNSEGHAVKPSGPPPNPPISQ